MELLKRLCKKTCARKPYAGEGVRLSEGPPLTAQPSDATAASVAADAAEKRMQQKNGIGKCSGKKKIQMLAKRELEEERRREQVNDPPPQQEVDQIQELEHFSIVSQVFYTSELLGEEHIRSKTDLLEDIKQFLLTQIVDCEDENDKVLAAVLMIYSLNSSQKRETAIETISKYCQNILDHPADQKYKSIRLANKTYQERVNPVIGAREFLKTVGFIEKIDNGNQFLVFEKPSISHLEDCLNSLKNGEAVPIKVARNLKIFRLKEGQTPKAPRLTDEFYNLTTAEIKAEQKKKEVQVERMLTLRTKEMRQKDEKMAVARYKYTLIRVRLPGNLLMQGVFGCSEPFLAVRLFVASTLIPSTALSNFNLRDALGHQIDDESASLAQLNLAPAALLHLTFVEKSMDSSEEVPVIAEKYLELIREIDQ